MVTLSYILFWFSSFHPCAGDIDLIVYQPRVMAEGQLKIDSNGVMIYYDLPAFCSRSLFEE